MSERIDKAWTRDSIGCLEWQRRNNIFFLDELDADNIYYLDRVNSPPHVASLIDERRSNTPMRMLFYATFPSDTTPK